MTELPTVLIVDDEANSLDSLTRILQDDFDVKTAETVEQAEEILQQEWVQIILCDQRMPNVTGVQFLAQVREQWPEVIRMIISGYTDAEDIIRGINEGGVYQYITKPWHPDSLLLTLKNAAQLYQLQRENEQFSVELKHTPRTLKKKKQAKQAAIHKTLGRDDGIVRTADSCMNQVCDTLYEVAPYDVSVMLTGESGTGKELCARALHYNSGRADKPFIVENCAALPDELLESELFGYKRGAFTGAVQDRVGLFEQANGGTIFLDEIGEVSAAFQVKLLRVIQEGEIRPLGSIRRRHVDVRVIAATNKALEQEVLSGRFREDLYYRLATISIELPPLRRRLGDIPVLAKALLDNAMKALGKEVRGFTEEALSSMQVYHWPGNIRELQNEIQRMLIKSRDGWLGADLLSTRVLQAVPKEQESDMALMAGVEGSLKDRIESLESRILRETLIRRRWNKSQAARELGLSRVGLRSKLERYGLDKDKKVSKDNGGSSRIAMANSR